MADHGKTWCRLSSALVASAVALLWGGGALAADTVETWDEGALDVDLYMTAEALEAEWDEGSRATDVMVGYGLVDRLSIYLGASHEGVEFMSAGGQRWYSGVFGTPLDTDHLDLDLFCDLSSSRLALGALEVGPALEINLDREPDLAAWGLYLRAASPIHPSRVIHPTLETTVGTYWTVWDGYQLLAEVDLTFNPGPDAEGRRVVPGVLAIGGNIGIDETFEFIMQVVLDLPNQGESTSGGAMVGLIVTLPTGGP